MQARPEIRLAIRPQLETASNPDMAVPAMRPARVVVVEDDPEMRRIIAEALRRDGHDVSEVDDGYELAAMLPPGAARQTGREADLIVTDLRLPGCTGLDVMREIRRRKLTVPVVLITAFGSPDTHAEARALGAAAVVDKPFDVDELRRLAAEILCTST